MSELDRVKEHLAYLKFWQGLMVVTLSQMPGGPDRLSGPSQPLGSSFSASVSSLYIAKLSGA